MNKVLSKEKVSLLTLSHSTPGHIIKVFTKCCDHDGHATRAREEVLLFIGKEESASEQLNLSIIISPSSCAWQPRLQLT